MNSRYPIVDSSVGAENPFRWQARQNLESHILPALKAGLLPGLSSRVLL